MAKRTRAEEDAAQTSEPTEHDIHGVTGLSDAISDFTPIAPAIDPEVELPERAVDPLDAAAAIPPANDINERMLKALASLEARQSDAGTNDLLAAAIASLAQAIAMQTDAQIASARLQAEATRRGQSRENQQVPMISDYNPRGDKDFPRPRLVCQMFIPYPADQDGLTREEIELLNLASELAPGDFVVRRNDNTKIKLRLSAITKLDSPELSRFAINHDTAFNNDYFRMMAPLSDWLRDILKQSPKTKTRAANVLSMDEEAALIIANKFNDGRVANLKEGEAVVSRGEL